MVTATRRGRAPATQHPYAPAAQRQYASAKEVDEIRIEIIDIAERVQLNSEQIQQLWRYEVGHGLPLWQVALRYMFRYIFYYAPVNLVQAIIHIVRTIVVIAIVGFILILALVWMGVGDLGIIFSLAAWKVYQALVPIVNGFISFYDFFGHHIPLITIQRLEHDPSTRNFAKFLLLHEVCPPFRNPAYALHFAVKMSSTTGMCVFVKRFARVIGWGPMMEGLIGWSVWETPNCLPPFDGETCFWLMFGYTLAGVVVVGLLILYVTIAAWHFVEHTVVFVAAVVYLFVIHPIIVIYHEAHEEAAHKIAEEAAVALLKLRAEVKQFNKTTKV